MDDYIERVREMYFFHRKEVLFLIKSVPDKYDNTSELTVHTCYSVRLDLQ